MIPSLFRIASALKPPATPEMICKTASATKLVNTFLLEDGVRVQLRHHRLPQDGVGSWHLAMRA